MQSGQFASTKFVYIFCRDMRKLSIFSRFLSFLALHTLCALEEEQLIKQKMYKDILLHSRAFFAQNVRRWLFVPAPGGLVTVGLLGGAYADVQHQGARGDGEQQQCGRLSERCGQPALEEQERDGPEYQEGDCQARFHLGYRDAMLSFIAVAIFLTRSSSCDENTFICPAAVLNISLKVGLAFFINANVATNNNVAVIKNATASA